MKVIVDLIICLNFLLIKPTKLRELIFIMKKSNKGKILTQEQAEQKILDILLETHKVPSSSTKKVTKPLN